MNMKFILNLRTVFVMLFVAAAMVSMAQPPSPPDLLGPDPVPVDGGASLLAMAGLGYATKRFKAARAARKAA